MKQEMNVDKFDFKLLSVLEQDARQSLSSMAKQLRSSQQVISYRMQTLEKKGVIGGYYCFIDIEKLRYTSYRTMIRLTNTDDEKKQQILDYLMRHENVLWLVDVGGRWDVLVNFMAQDIIQYSTMLRDFRNMFPQQIQSYDVLTMIEGLHFGRDYFTKTKREKYQHTSFGGKQTTEKNTLDDLDIKLLQHLSEQGRMNAADIARKEKVSPNTIVLRMKSLKKRGIIKGFKPLIHLDKLGYQGYKALIKFQNSTETTEKKIIQELQEHIEVVGVLRLVGLWDFEIEFEVKSQEDMLRATRKLRDVLKDVTKEFEILPLYKEYKYNFCPKMI